MCHCTALFFVSLHSTIFGLTAQHYSLSHSTALFFVSLCSTILCFTAQHYSLSQCTALFFFVSLYSTFLCLTGRYLSTNLLNGFFNQWIYPSSLRTLHHLYFIPNFGQDTERYLVCEVLGIPFRCPFQRFFCEWKIAPMSEENLIGQSSVNNIPHPLLQNENHRFNFQST